VKALVEGLSGIQADQEGRLTADELRHAKRSHQRVVDAEPGIDREPDEQSGAAVADVRTVFRVGRVIEIVEAVTSEEVLEVANDLLCGERST
jgi:hypothetical protein